MNSVSFKSAESILHGYYFPSKSVSETATVIFLQGFPGVEGDELICERLAQKGLNVLTFNYRGTFGSQGYFSFSNVVVDIGAALDFIQEFISTKSSQIDRKNIILGGWSFGSAMVPAGAVQNPSIKKIFMISGRNFGKEAEKIKEDPVYAQTVVKNLDSLREPNGPIRFQDNVISDLIEMHGTFDYEILAPSLKDRHILLINGWDDDLVPIEDHTIPFYRSLIRNGAKNVSIEAVQDDHEFSKTKDQITKIIIKWISGT